MRELRWFNSMPVAFFAEVADRTAAESIVRAILWIDAATVEQSVEDNAWYDHQLVGLEVRREGELLGTVSEVQHFPAQDLLAVKTANGTVLVPFVESIVPSVDLDAGVVSVTPPAGLFEELQKPIPLCPARKSSFSCASISSASPRLLRHARASARCFGKAKDRGLLDLRVHDLRDAARDKHRTVNNTPAGGGAGMVMKPEPWGEMLDGILAESGADAKGAGEPLIIFPSPAGEVFTERMARELAGEQQLIFGCSRCEGPDQRIFDEYAERGRLKLVSLGDYVLNGGEVATLAMIEAIARLLPGVVGNPESLVEESHEYGLLKTELHEACGVAWA